MPIKFNEKSIQLNQHQLKTNQPLPNAITNQSNSININPNQLNAIKINENNPNQSDTIKINIYQNQSKINPNQSNAITINQHQSQINQTPSTNQSNIYQ